MRRHRIHTEAELEAAEGAFAVRKDWAGNRPCDRIRTVLLDWSSRRSFEPELPEDVPTYRIHRPEELIPLLKRLEEEGI